MVIFIVQIYPSLCGYTGELAASDLHDFEVARDTRNRIGTSDDAASAFDVPTALYSFAGDGGALLIQRSK